MPSEVGADEDALVEDVCDATVDMSDIDKTLHASLDNIRKESLVLTTKDLEATNSKFKPYLRQLSELKSNLVLNLKEIESSKAYFVLGVSKDSSTNQLKKVSDCDDRCVSLTYH